MRKGHGSTKVPGVKLRPAAPTKARKSNVSSKQPAWAQSSNPDDVDSLDILKSCKKPFVGQVICASGVTDKVNLFQQAVQLGAQTSSDLTDRVTHLICESPGSAKYNYCVEHGIPIMRPSWISDAYGKWLSGESIDVTKSTSIHRHSIFKTVRLCLTAIDDVQKRKQIRKQLEKNGGTFIDALGKDSQLTHLLCGPDRGGNADAKGLTSKMQFIEKANKSSADKVHLVWEDWFWDCLEFKGVLNEKDYLANGPRPQRRIMREASPLLAPITSTAEQSHQRSTIATSVLDANPDVEEVANVKRVPEATARLWEGMLKKRGFEMKSGKLTRSSSKDRASSSASAENSRRSPSPLSLKQAVERDPSRLSSSRVESSLNAAFKRTKSFAAKAADPEVSKSALQRVRSTPAAAFQRPSSSSAVASSSAPRNEESHIPEGERSLFVGLRFRALGEASGPKLTEALELRGGAVLASPDDEVDFIIVRLAGGNAFYHNEQDEAERAKFRTECWIEQCMFEERICASNEHPAFVPLRIPTPIPGTDKLVLHISGLTASEKTPSVRLMKAIGVTVTDQLSRRNTHLLCPCGSGPKFNKAQEWQIPVLNLQWLYSTVKTGEIQNIFDYLVKSASRTEGASEGGMMTDITNSEFVQGSSKGKTTSKSSDRSQSSNSSSAGVFASHTEPESAFSDSWTANALLSEPAPAHPPTSSPTLSSRSPDSRPSTPFPNREGSAREAAMPLAPAISSHASPTKPKKTMRNDLGRVPSSATPSPLKMPVQGAHASELEGAASTSPATATTLSGESASVLKDAIASLLGKRSSSDDHENESQVQPHGPPPRASKRSKPPPRTKSKQDGSVRSFSRTTSIETLGRTGSALSGAGSGYPFEFATGPGSSGDSGDFVESPAGLEMPGTRPEAVEAADESMRVTYEDPSQRAEKRRLLSLIAGEVMDADADEEIIPKHQENIVVEELPEEIKKPQPRPRRKGRNLVRRASTRIAEQC